MDLSCNSTSCNGRVPVLLFTAMFSPDEKEPKALEVKCTLTQIHWRDLLFHHSGGKTHFPATFTHLGKKHPDKSAPGSGNAGKQPETAICIFSALSSLFSTSLLSGSSVNSLLCPFPHQENGNKICLTQQASTEKARKVPGASDSARMAAVVRPSLHAVSFFVGFPCMKALCYYNVPSTHR